MRQRYKSKFAQRFTEPSSGYIEKVLVYTEEAVFPGYILTGNTIHVVTNSYNTVLLYTLDGYTYTMISKEGLIVALNVAEFASRMNASIDVQSWRSPMQHQMQVYRCSVRMSVIL